MRSIDVLLLFLVAEAHDYGMQFLVSDKATAFIKFVHIDCVTQFCHIWVGSVSRITKLASFRKAFRSIIASIASPIFKWLS